MKIRIRRGCIEETLLLVLFGFYVLIAHWIWFGRGIQETAMIVFVDSCAFEICKDKANICQYFAGLYF